MNFVSKIIIALSCLTFVSACGKEKTSLNGQTSNFDAQTAYINMPAPDYNVSFTPAIFGGSTTQRQTSTRFCRKTGATIPNPTYSYSCWEQTSSGVSAQSTYNLVSAYSYYGMSIGMIGGSIDEAISADQSIICHKSTPMVPNPISTYVCYTKL